MTRIRSLKRIFVFIVSLSIVFSVVIPREMMGEETSSRDYRLNKEFFIGFGKDIYEVARSPGGWEGDDWWRLTAVLGTGVLFYAFDQKIHDWSQDRTTPVTKDWAAFGSFLGNGFFLGGLITSLYLGGEIFEERGLRKTALLSLESWLTSGAIVMVLKTLTGRARPYTGLGAYQFEPFTFSSAYHSFPSGHASSAFAVATVVADQTDSLIVDVLAYSLSTFSAFSRVHESKHWASDVLIGAAIGYFVGKKICAMHRGHDQKNIQLDFSLSPLSRGITVSISF